MLKHSAQLGVNVTVTAVNIIRKQNNRWGKESLIKNQKLGTGKMWEGNKGHSNEWSDK